MQNYIHEIDNRAIFGLWSPSLLGVGRLGRHWYSCDQVPLKDRESPSLQHLLDLGSMAFSAFSCQTIQLATRGGREWGDGVF